MTEHSDEAPAVSVMITVRNDERRLPRAIDSIRAQTFPSWEVIVVDDGSSDGTLAVARALAESDPRVHVYSQPPRGISQGLNECLRHARGTWVAIQDADDYSHPRRFERQVAFLEEHPSVGLLGTYGRRVTAKGRDLGRLEHGPLSVEAFRAGRERGELFYLISTSMMMRRDVLEEVGGYPEEYVQGCDVALTNLRMAPVTDIVAIPEELVYREMNARSITRTNAPQVLTAEVIALNIERRLQGLPALSPDEAEAELTGGTWLGRMRCRRRALAFHSQTAATAHLASGSPRGLVSLALALGLAPIDTTGILISRVRGFWRTRRVGAGAEPR